MTIETATYISDLNSLYPESGTNAGEGDDHLRLIKATLDSSFPNFAGAAMNCTEAELNILDGCTASTAELNYLDLTTGAGTGEVSKALVADGTGDIDLTAIDFNNVDIDSGSIDGATLGAASAVTVTGASMGTAVTGVTQSASDDSTKLATTEYVDRNQISFGAHISASYAVNSVTTQLIEFDTEDHDDGGCFDHTTHKFTAPIAGVYAFTFTMSLNGTVSTTDIRLIKDKGGAGQDYIGRVRMVNAGVSTSPGANISAVVKLEANDVVGAYITTTANATTGGPDATHFGGHLVYPT